jgi:hypothetical protein
VRSFKIYQHFVKIASLYSISKRWQCGYVRCTDDDMMTNSDPLIIYHFLDLNIVNNPPTPDPENKNDVITLGETSTHSTSSSSSHRMMSKARDRCPKQYTDTHTEEHTCMMIMVR